MSLFARWLGLNALTTEELSMSPVHQPPADCCPTITRIEAWRVAYPVEDRRGAPGAREADPFNASSATFTEIESLLVRVTDSDGCEGWGECFGHKSNQTTMTALESMVIPFSIGRPAVPEDFSTQAARTFHPFGRGGPVSYASSGIDIALWDIVAKRSGLPLRSLLNSASPSSAVEGYASLPSFAGDRSRLLSAIAELDSRGFSSVKLHEVEGESVAAAVKAFPHVSVATDMNCHWQAEDWPKLVDELAELDLWFIEEPTFPFSDSATLRRLRGAGMVIAAGENFGDADDLVSACRTGALDIVQPSVAKIGGVTALERIYSEVPEIGVAVMPHCYYYGPAFFATAQVIAAHPDQPQLVESPYFNWFETLHSQQWCAPVVELSESPGLGVTFEPEDFKHRILSESDSSCL